MTKAETISALKKYEQQYWAFEKSYDRCKQLSNQISEIKKPFREEERIACSNGKICVHFLGIILGIGIAFEILFGRKRLEQVLLGLKWWIIPILVLAFLLFYFYRTTSIRAKNNEIIAENTRRHREWLEKQNNLSYYSQQLKKEQSKQQRLKQQAWDQGIRSGLRGDYMNPYVVRDLIRYLETGRSDTLKEALNLHEAEKREARRDEAARRHQAEMERYASEQAEAARAAAENAEDAAFWSAAAAFASFSAADKISKAQNNTDYRIV